MASSPGLSRRPRSGWHGARFKFERNFFNLDQDLVQLRNILTRRGVHVERIEPLPEIRRVKTRPEPPKLAEFLLTALSSPSRGQSIVGDLNERFANECEKLGRRRAIRLYWARTVESLWPLLRRAIGKTLKLGAVIAAVRRLF